MKVILPKIVLPEAKRQRLLLISAGLLLFTVVYWAFFSVFRMPVSENFSIKENTLLVASRFAVLTKDYSLGDLMIVKSKMQSHSLDVAVIVDYNQATDSYIIKTTQFNDVVNRQEFVAKVMLPKLNPEVLASLLSQHYGNVYEEEENLDESTAPSRSDLIETYRKELQVDCANNNPIYSEDKNAVACIIDQKYVVGRKLAVTTKNSAENFFGTTSMSDGNYYRLYEETGRFSRGEKEYIAYADYPSMFTDAGFYGSDLDEVYSRIFEIDTEKQTLKVVADPFMFSNELLREWFLRRRTPQFILSSDQNKEYRLSPDGRYLLAELVDCTGCDTIAKEAVIDLLKQNIVSIGMVYLKEDATMTWLNNNTLEWYEGKYLQSNDADHSYLGSGYVLTNMGRRTRSF